MHACSAFIFYLLMQKAGFLVMQLKYKLTFFVFYLEHNTIIKGQAISV